MKAPSRPRIPRPQRDHRESDRVLCGFLSLLLKAPWASRTRAEAERLLRGAISEIRQDRHLPWYSCGVVKGHEGILLPLRAAKEVLDKDTKRCSDLMCV